MKSCVVLLCLWAGLGLSAWAQSSPATPPTAALSASPASVDSALYRSLGEKAGISRLMDDFVNRLAADPRLSEAFRESNLPHLKEQLTEQICQVAGGPCVYQGVDMRTAHEDMNIRRAQFNALVEDLQQAMDQEGIPFRQQNRLLAILAPMYRDVVTAPGR